MTRIWWEKNLERASPKNQHINLYHHLNIVDESCRTGQTFKEKNDNHLPERSWKNWSRNHFKMVKSSPDRWGELFGTESWDFGSLSMVIFLWDLWLHFVWSTSWMLRYRKMTSFSWPQEWVPNIECVNTWVFMISQPGMLPKCSHTLDSCTTIHPSCQKKLTHHHVHIKWPGLHTKWLIYLYQMALIKIIYIHIKYSIRYILSTCSNPSSVAGVRIVFFFLWQLPSAVSLRSLHP